MKGSFHLPRIASRWVAERDSVKAANEPGVANEIQPASEGIDFCMFLSGQLQGKAMASNESCLQCLFFFFLPPNMDNLSYFVFLSSFARNFEQFSVSG